MTDLELDQLDDRFPEVALAALNAASEAAKKSNLPRVVLIDGGLYRISPSGEKELIRELAPWVTVSRTSQQAGRMTLRVRMFAGPNGSGKTTVQRDIAQNFAPDFLGVVVNPDDLEAIILRDGRLALEPFRIRATDQEVREAFITSEFLKQQQLAASAASIRCDGREIDFGGLQVNSYHASVLADFLRRKLLAERISFSFETVMSEYGKVHFLRDAQQSSFRTYLYFVATDDPEINIAERIARRVADGGHNVPKDKVISRYRRSLDLVFDAIRHSSRAYLFDSSGDSPLFIAESTNGNRPEMRNPQMPIWFKNHVWNKF